MNTSIQHPAPALNYTSVSQASLWSQFVNWTKTQEESRFLWLAIGIVGHGCFITVATILVIAFTGNNFVFWPFAIAAMTMTVVVNLAAMPTKITIPVFFISVLIDIAVISLSIAGMAG